MHTSRNRKTMVRRISDYNGQLGSGEEPAGWSDCRRSHYGRTVLWTKAPHNSRKKARRVNPTDSCKVPLSRPTQRVNAIGMPCYFLERSYGATESGDCLESFSP
jgi:hypothetical protein